MPHFTAATFDFLFDLDVHNERAWFDAHRDDYERHARDPMLRFIADLGAPLADRVSRHLLAIPKIQGGSMFRIYRDTRFSKDGRPFKSNIGAQFRHELTADDVHAPGLYLHLEPGNCFMGGGVYRPPTAVLNVLRDAIVAKPGVWTRIRNEIEDAGLSLGGEQLKTSPRGYDADHRHIEDLRRTSMVFSRGFAEEEACAEDFLEQYVSWAEDALPLLRFICRELQVPF